MTKIRQHSIKVIAEQYNRQSIVSIKQDAQLSQWDRAAGCVSFGQKWKTGTGRQYFTDII